MSCCLIANKSLVVNNLGCIKTLLNKGCYNKKKYAIVK